MDDLIRIKLVRFVTADSAQCKSELINYSCMNINFKLFKYP